MDINALHRLREQLDLVQKSLTEGKVITTVEDFLKFLEVNPKLGSSAFAYYTAPVYVNKNLEGRGKNAVPNPMHSIELGHSIIFKSGWYSFSFGQLYAEKMKKINPDWTPDLDRNSSLTKDPNFKYVEHGDKGDYINILPHGSKSTYAIYDIDRKFYDLKNPEAYKIVSYNDVKEYLPNRGEDKSPFPVRKLMVNRIYQLAAGNHVLKNKEFIYVYFGEEPNRI